MKELIEKTFEKVINECSKEGIDVSCENTHLVVNKYKNVLLREIEDQESKEFNPVECGFDRLSENSNEYIKYVYDTKKEY